MTIYKEVSGQGEEVVILHGWSCDHRYTQPIVDLLSDRYRVTNVDLPGCGQSDWGAHSKNIHDVADLLLPHLPYKAAYIGWSFGGLVSISIGSRYPKRMKRFIGITTTPKFVGAEEWPGLPKSGFKGKIEEVGFKTFFQKYYEMEFGSFDPKPAEYQTLLRMLESSKINLDILMQGIDIVDATDLRKEFQTLTCPIDLILGEEDASIPKAAFEEIKRLNPNVEIHSIPHAHHMPFWTHPKQFNHLLSHILSKRRTQS